MYHLLKHPSLIIHHILLLQTIFKMFSHCSVIAKIQTVKIQTLMNMPNLLPPPPPPHHHCLCHRLHHHQYYTLLHPSPPLKDNIHVDQISIPVLHDFPMFSPSLSAPSGSPGSLHHIDLDSSEADINISTPHSHFNDDNRGTAFDNFIGH